MSKENKSKLEPTYGNFEIRGIISSIEEPRVGTTGNGSDFKSLKIQVAIDKNSNLKLDLFGMKTDTVEIVKFKGKTVERKEIKWANRTKLEEGWSLSNLRAVGIGAELKDGKTKGGLKMYAGYDAVQEIVENFSEGDSVAISGSLRFSTFTNQAGEDITIANYNIQKIYKIKEIDFDAEDFKPYAKFEQKIVVAGTEKVAEYGEDKVKALVVDGIIITDKNGTFVHQEFVVLVDKREILAKNLAKLPEYSVIPLKGNIINRAVVDETSSDETNEWGFDDQQEVIRSYERYFEILAADGTAIEKSKYTEDDFFVEDVIADDDKDETDEDIFVGDDDAEDIDDEWLSEE